MPELEQLSNMCNVCNVCNLWHQYLHTIPHNDSSQYSWSILLQTAFFYSGQLPPCFWLLHCSQCYCPCSYSLISHSNQQSHGFTVQDCCRPPAPPQQQGHLPRRQIQIPKEALHPRESSDYWLVTWHLRVGLDLRRPFVIPCGCWWYYHVSNSFQSNLR